MTKAEGTWRLAAGLALLGALAGLQGCTYLRHRGNDAIEMVDLGFTWSKKPYVAVHGCALGLASLGGGMTDGQFVGIGGNQFGVTRHYHKNLGLLVWSYDEIGWGDDIDIEKPETLEQFHIGPVGWLKYPQRRPPYAFACTHYLHLGWAGLIANLRYAEMVDFLAGWTTADLCGDDGKDKGDWPWRKDHPRKKPIPRPKLPF
jgi:hypothetical protein